MKQMKKCLSLLLAFVLSFSCVSNVAVAETSGISTSEDGEVVEVNLKVGETVQYTDFTADYSNQPMSDPKGVVTIGIQGRSFEGKTTVVQKGIAANNNWITFPETITADNVMDIEECAYTAEQSGENWIFKKTLETGYVTLDPNKNTASGGRTPNWYQSGSSTGKATITIESRKTNTFSIQKTGSNYMKFLYDREVGFIGRDDYEENYCDFEIYKEVQQTSEDSLIQGYAQVKSVDEIQEGGKYLVVRNNKAYSPADATATYYCLNPVNSTNSYDHVAKIVGETSGISTIEFKAVKEGSTSIKIGNITYVIEAVPMQLCLGLNESLVVENAFVEDENNKKYEDIIEVSKNEEFGPYKKVTTDIMESGKYLIGKGNFIVKNEVVNETVGSYQETGLQLETVDFQQAVDLSEHIWNITVSENGEYNISCEKGYLNVSPVMRNGHEKNGMMSITEESKGPWKIIREGEKFSIGQELKNKNYGEGTDTIRYNFDHWGSGSSNIICAWGEQASKNGKKLDFNLYQSVESTLFTPKGIGKAIVKLGDIIYDVEVVECRNPETGDIGHNMILDTESDLVRCTNEGCTKERANQCLVEISSKIFGVVNNGVKLPEVVASGEVGENGIYSYSYDAGVTMRASVMPGYDFLGWYYKKDVEKNNLENPVSQNTYYSFEIMDDYTGEDAFVAVYRKHIDVGEAEEITEQYDIDVRLFNKNVEDGTFEWNADTNNHRTGKIINNVNSGYYDNNLFLNGNWMSYIFTKGGNFHNNTKLQAKENTDARLEYTFSGTGIKLYGETANDYGDLEIIITDKDKNEVRRKIVCANNGSTNTVVLYNSSDDSNQDPLKNGTYKIEVRLMSKTEGCKNHGKAAIGLDYFEVTRPADKDVTLVTAACTLANNESVSANLSGGGSYNVGDIATLTAPLLPGKTFIGWYKADMSVDESGIATVTKTYNRVSGKTTCKVTVDEDNMGYAAVYEAVDTAATVTLDGNVNDITYTVTSNKVTSDTQNYSEKIDCNLGDVVTLTAPENCVGWKNAYGVYVARRNDYAFTVTGSVAGLTPVYNTVADKTLVVFESYYKQEMARLEIKTANEMTAAKVPAIPARYGYTAAGWKVNDTVVGVDAVVAKVQELLKAGTTVTLVAEYTEDTTQKCSVIVKNAEASEGTAKEYKLSEIVKVQATPVANKVFSHWIDGEGNIMSYNETYSFYAVADITLEAVYVQDESKKETPVGITEILNVKKVTEDGLDKMTFVSLSTVPSGYTIHKAGVIVALENHLQGRELTEKTAQRIVGDAWKGTTYRYTYSVRKTQGATICARAYLVYSDKEGNMYTVYGDVVTDTDAVVVQ